MSVDEKILEARILELRLTAPRVTPDEIDALIRSVTYTILPSGKVMVCEMTLINGFATHGFSYAVSRENFNEDIGKQVSYRQAREEIWKYAGFLLQQRLYEQALTTA